MSITPRSPDPTAREKVSTWVTSQWKLRSLRVNSQRKSTALIAWATTLGKTDVTALLQANLDQEKKADALLTQVAGTVNKMAMAA